MTHDPDPHFEALVVLFKTINDVTSNIQNETACGLLMHPNVKRDLEEHLRKPESIIQERIQSGVNGFVARFPLASMMNQNMFMGAVAKHADLTGNDLMIRVIDRINQMTMDEQHS